MLHRLALAALMALTACGSAEVARRAVDAPSIAAPARPSLAERAIAALPGTPPARADVPEMRWGERSGGDDWTRAVLATLEAEGVTLTSTIPRDVETFCPAYARQSAEGRRAFWAGLLSAVARHESGWNPAARGGGGRYLGLMQIAPGTWRSHGCRGKILDGGDNLSCAARIMVRSVVRDGAIAGGRGGWRGVARDWMPLRSTAQRAEIAGWTRRQSYCSGG